MPIVDFTNVVTLLLAVVLFVLILYLGKETHKSWLFSSYANGISRIINWSYCRTSMDK